MTSTAAWRRLGLPLAVRVALPPFLALLACWLLGAWAWKRQANAGLGVGPDFELAALRGVVRAEVQGLATTRLPELDWADAEIEADLAREEELRRYRAVRRKEPMPQREELLRERLVQLASRPESEPFRLDLGWIRRARGEPWTTGGYGPPPSGVPRKGLHVVADTAGRSWLFRVVEVSFSTEDGEELVAGLGHRVVEPVLPGRWRVRQGEPDARGPRLLESEDWGEPPPEPLSYEAKSFVAGGVVMTLELVVPAFERVSWSELFAGRAGPLTKEWREWLLVSLPFVALAGVVLAWLGLRLTRALDPLVVGARRLSQGDFGELLPVERDDEIGLLATALNDVTLSLKGERIGRAREARLAAWRDAARVMAHELKNPLQPIRATAENLLRWKREDPARLDERLESRLEAVLAEVDQLTALAQEFSDFARLPEPSPEPTDLVPLLREVAELQVGTTSSLRLIDELPERLPALVDRGQLRQLVTNLLTNARQALGADGGSITLRGGSAGAQVSWFSVADDGPGFEGPLEKIFNTGFSTKTASGGQGLGTWTCQRIATEHGGSITAERVDGGGLEMRVELPTSSA
ncbi:MAG: HAMP domain-containing sensor histidine kinase [Acidobacteriota bacterium]